MTTLPDAPAPPCPLCGGTGTARFDPATEEPARPVRERIADLYRQLHEAQQELAGLYDYQAGPAPVAQGAV